jgi:hypothetical protein
MDDKAELHRFAEMLVRSVRDQSIDSCDALASRRMFGPTGDRWRDLLAEPEAREAISQLIPGAKQRTINPNATSFGTCHAHRCHRSQHRA